ncbi:triose-phosphate isomerase [Hyphobacterium sp.]|uniref:triose-phosphate isomerase n=1 Tax=Hyphobacterium sp. TaxID=2004662 RepID=UPI003BAAE488
MQRRKLIAGNWKMNGTGQSLGFFDEIRQASEANPGVDILIAPPATLIHRAAARAGRVLLAGQDCHAQTSGAHTGDLSADMIREAGASHVIIGHSERRADHGETSETVRAKALAAQAAGLIPIICVGESEDDRRAGREQAIVGDQLEHSLPAEGEFIIAYEPVWAIGTGLTASESDIASMHAFIRGQLANGPARLVLYGGSVKPGNAAGILQLADVDGALVGGASLKASDFSAIISAAGKFVNHAE